MPELSPTFLSGSRLGTRAYAQPGLKWDGSEIQERVGTCLAVPRGSSGCSCRRTRCVPQGARSSQKSREKRW